MLAPPPPPRPDWALFLDIDGTLIDIAPTPSAIHIPSELPGRLARLAESLGGALALVSGRAVGNIAHMMAPHAFAAAGLHGLERLDATGRLVRTEPPPGLDLIRADLAAFAAERPGVVLEDKALTVALHYRLAPDRQAECEAAARAAAARAPGWKVMAGKMVYEIKPAGIDKGGALRAFMAEPPFAGRVPVFVGDDLTDEDGFAAALDLGGQGVLVGPERPTRAGFRLDDVAAARAWLGV